MFNWHGYRIQPDLMTNTFNRAIGKLEGEGTESDLNVCKQELTCTSTCF